MSEQELKEFNDKREKEKAKARGEILREIFSSPPRKEGEPSLGSCLCVC
ncbi:MAG: hypothetical protein Q8O93_04520 [bacterium]|nr:hypothetical protein [bacterium]